MISRRPLLTAAAGLLTVVLTPFVFFPEIMGDVGVTHASAFRNGAALVVLVAGGVITIGGLLVFGWRVRRRRRKNA